MNLGHRFLVLLLFFAITSWPPAAAAKDNKQQKGEALLARACEFSDLDSDGCSPFILKANLKVEEFQGATAEGIFFMAWASDRQWHEEVLLANYREVRVAAEGKGWRTRSLRYTPAPVESIRFAVDPVRMLGLQGRLKIMSVREELAANERLTCVTERLPGHVQQEACVDTSTGVLRWVQGLRRRIEYSDYTSYGAKLVPHTIRDTLDGKTTWQYQISRVTQDLGENPSSFFTVPPGAQEWASCVHPTKPDPVKISDAPRHLQPHPDLLVGQIEMLVEVGPEGRVHDIIALGSTSPTVGKAEIRNAIREWRFKPAMCGPVPVPSELTINMQYYY